MTGVRLGAYALYVVLGAVILVRMLAVGLRWETLSGMVFGAALIALGAYRLAVYRKTARERR